MKQNKTVKLIEKIFPSVKDDLKKISKVAKEFKDCSSAYFVPEYTHINPDPKQLLEFKTMVEKLICKIKKIIPEQYEISMHNAYFHTDYFGRSLDNEVGPGYIHVYLRSEDENEYCFSYSGYVWHGITLIGRILKSGKMKSGSMSYGGNFLFDDSIKKIQGEREIAKAKKEKDKSETGK